MDDNDTNPDNDGLRRHHRGFPDRVPRQRRRQGRIFRALSPARRRAVPEDGPGIPQPGQFHPHRTGAGDQGNPPGHRFADERRRLLRRSPQRIRRRVREPAQRRPVPDQAQGSPRAARRHSAPDRDPPGRHRAGSVRRQQRQPVRHREGHRCQGHPGTQATAVPQVRRRGGGSADHQRRSQPAVQSSAWSRSSRRSPSWRWRGRTA